MASLPAIRMQPSYDDCESVPPADPLIEAIRAIGPNTAPPRPRDPEALEAVSRRIRLAPR